jgi:hypothetical protein
MTFYTSAAATANRLLLKFGAPATLTRVTPGGYDPATGTTTADVTQTWTGTGAKFDYESKFVDGTRIRSGDQYVLLSVVGVSLPQEGDTIQIGTDVLKVVIAEVLRPALVNVLFTVQVRGLLT